MNTKIRITHYYLVDRIPQEIDFGDAWLAFMSNEQNYIVKRTKIGETLVETKFLCQVEDSIEGVFPMLFKTWVKGGDNDGYETFYSSWFEAECGHAKILQDIMNSEKGRPLY